VVDSEVAADGGDPAKVDRVTIGFNAVADLAAGTVDAATGFWNAEAVALQRQGVPVRVFKVDRYGAPRYPELVLCTSASTLQHEPELVHEVVGATKRGYQATLRDPVPALDNLLAANPGLDRAEQQAELHVLLSAFSPPGQLRTAALVGWAHWDAEHGILAGPATIAQAKEVEAQAFPPG
jgi:putative hydroxymethylpyrimidine transport system substrate-binding protein